MHRRLPCSPPRSPPTPSPDPPPPPQVWCLAVGSLGDLVVSGSHDRSLRRWERTDEPFFVEEEKEKRLESLFEADLEASTASTAALGSPVERR